MKTEKKLRNNTQMVINCLVFYSIFKLVLALMALLALVCRKTANKQTLKKSRLSTEPP
jgi:cytochrome c oxidase assembly protein Cox11